MEEKVETAILVYDKLSSYVSFRYPDSRWDEL